MSHELDGHPHHSFDSDDQISAASLEGSWIESSSEEGDNSTPPATEHSPTAVRASPSSICVVRKMSTAVVTTEEIQHTYVEGRPKMVLASNTMQSNGSISRRPTSIKRSCTAPVNVRIPDFEIHPAPLRMEYWGDTPAMNFKVRGKSYVKDKCKVPSQESVFRLLTVDLLKVKEPVMTGICAHPNERIQQALKREMETGIRELPEFVFAVNYCIPADPFFHWIAYLGVDDVSVLRDPSTPLGRLTEPFFFGDSDEFRTNTFKLIPRIVEGNFVVRKAVGSKPTILGRKLKQSYIRSDRYFELIVDIGSDPVAERIVKLALGSAKSLVVDMMFVLEGSDEETLPERILGGVRMQRLDFKRKDLQRMCFS